MKILDNDQMREMTDEETNAYSIWLNNVKKQLQAEQKAIAERASLKQATLEKLGLTAEEVAALLS